VLFWPSSDTRESLVGEGTPICREGLILSSGPGDLLSFLMDAFGMAVHAAIVSLKITEPTGRRNLLEIVAGIALARENCVHLAGAFLEYGSTPSNPPEAAQKFLKG